jgi:hypothetical protein
LGDVLTVSTPAVLPPQELLGAVGNAIKRITDDGEIGAA